MFSRIKDNINLTKASLYLEKINTGNQNQKIKAYEKLKKLPITTEIGIRIIENASKRYSEEYEAMNINSMLLLLLFDNYRLEYNEPIINNFDDYEFNTKLDLLSYLASSDNLDAIILWKNLILNKFDTADNKIPIGNLSNNKNNYELLFPDLYNVFKSDNKKYSLIILLNNFINLGIVPIEDLKKNKKNLIKHILMPLEELTKFKFKADEDYMSNKDYLGLRYVVESTINIEYYCNNTKTKALLDKLFKHKDNQLKLFVLESYIKKKKSIKKLNLNPIAKDLRSRYLLYNLLAFYDKKDLMPKKYNNEKDIYESEIYNIYSNSFNYDKEPKSIKFFKQIEKDGLKYYLYKFKAKKEYGEIVKDFATDYLLKNNGLDKYIADVYEEYIGIAGGHDENDPLISLGQITKYYDVYDKNKSIDEIIDSFFKKEITVITPEEVEPVKVPKKPSKLRKIFNMTNFYVLQLLIIVVLIVALVLYIKGYNLFNLKQDNYINSYITYRKTDFDKIENFNEINGHDLYNIDDGIYYVLIFNKKNKSEYYTLFKTIIENDSRVYYIDLNKEENHFLYGPNELNQVVSQDRFIKVNGRDFEYYIDGKENILKELKDETSEIIKNNTLRKIEEASKVEEIQESIENPENE